MDDLKEKLKTEIEQADWNMLKPHFEKDSVFLVDSSLDLIDVGVAIAQDKSQIVGLWLQDNLIKRPSAEEAAHYNEEEFKKRFDFLIIQPYVLIKHIESEQLN